MNHAIKQVRGSWGTGTDCAFKLMRAEQYPRKIVFLVIIYTLLLYTSLLPRPFLQPTLLAEILCWNLNGFSPIQQILPLNLSINPVWVYTLTNRIVTSCEGQWIKKKVQNSTA